MLERTLSIVISGFFPGVARANVVIQPVSERHIGESVEPSASVQISTRPNADINARQIVESAASTVASAVPNLKRERVAVSINGMTRHVSSSDISSSGEIYEAVSAEERRVSEKISNMLMPGALIAVTVDVENNTSEETREEFDPTKTVVKERTSETRTEETSQPVPQSAEPGAVPNTGLSLASGAASGAATSSSETSRSENSIFPSRSVTRTSKPAGKGSIVSAAVRLPRSYFVAKYKQQNPLAKEPDETALQTAIAVELPKYRDVIQQSIGMKSPEKISVDTYYDVTTIPADVTVAASTMTSLLGSHAKEVAVGALALVSLFMVSTIVKKGSPTPLLAMQAEPAGPSALSATAAEMLAGIAQQGGSTMDGIELDDDTVRSQQMVEQVATMVKEDPDAAATLVKRWLHRT